MVLDIQRLHQQIGEAATRQEELQSEFSKLERSDVMN